MELKGNMNEYSFDYIEEINNENLNNKTLCVLGSSVTEGAASNGYSLGEYFKKRFNMNLIKEAVSGTTLCTLKPNNYVERMFKIDKNSNIDIFIVQLSTNDASQKLPLGEIINTCELESIDTNTITGAIEYIINYARKTWNPKILFYTGSYYDSEEYKEMVKRILEIKDIYNIGVLDLYNNKKFNNISEELRNLYMLDPIHPTKAGYRDWWGIELEKQLVEYIK